ncbi:hypothetical protein AB0H42_19415 [Nocardia sp. NPDC050799]|uniref:hypothetical protein n=1 Tax=Nocardia sp. NPDC050799 TaxID=3154842 RepID=UPI0033D7C4E9
MRSAGRYGRGWAPALGPAERAVELASRTGDRLVRSAALDALAAAQLWAGDTLASASTSRQRVESLAGVPASELELGVFDAVVLLHAGRAVEALSRRRSAGISGPGRGCGRAGVPPRRVR